MSTDSAESTTSAGRIIVGVDGSPSSEQALRWAAEQARRTGQEVHAVIGWEYPPSYGGAPVSDLDWAGDSRGALEKAVANTLDEANAQRVVQHVVHAHPAQALLDAADGADLLVVGCRGYGGFAGMLLGSVSQHVVAHAPCPVVVLHEHSDAEDARS
jgi:nucleotide-binding universal stress UspA family protein